MDAPTEEERVHAQACYAVAMHLHANRRVGKAARVISVLGIVAAIYFSSLWFLVGAFALSVATYFVVIQSCVRFVHRTTGMPSDVQVLFSRKYKTDPEFAREVDKQLGPSL